MSRRTMRRRVGVPDAFRRLPMSEEELRGLPSFRVIRVSTEAQDYRGGPEGQAHELDRAQERLGVTPTGLELHDASPGWDAGRLEPALGWAAEGKVRVGLIPYFSRFMRDPLLAFSYRDQFHARGCVLYFADRRLLSSDPARQGDFGDLAVKAHIDNLDRAHAIADGMFAKFRTKADPGGHPATGFRRVGYPRPVLEPDPETMPSVVRLFELFASGDYTDSNIAVEAARLGLVAPMTGRPLTAKGVGEVLRNPIYNGWVVRFRGFADEQRVEALWRRREGPDGGNVAGPPVSDDLWERVQALRHERTTVGVRRRPVDRVYVPNMKCAGCGTDLYGHAGSGIRRMVHPMPLCDDWREASHGRQGFHAEIYEWQLEAILGTAKLDAATKSRIMTALGPATPVPDATAIRRLERELRDLGSRNALGQLPDASYFERRGRLLAELDEAHSPPAARVKVDPKRAIRFLEDLESLWSAPLPEGEEHEDLRQTFERRRADATATGFAVLAALGPELVRIELAEDPHTAAPLALSLHPEKAELTGERAHVLSSLLGGNRSRLHFAQTYDAARKRNWRERGNGTLRYVGRGERSRSFAFQLTFVIVPGAGMLVEVA